jgi:hypothetical protein
VGWGAVEAVSVLVVAACRARVAPWRAASWTSRSEAPSSSEIVTKPCRRACGCREGRPICSPRRLISVPACWRVRRRPVAVISNGPCDRQALAASTACATAAFNGATEAFVRRPLPFRCSIRWRPCSPRSSISAPTASDTRKPSSNRSSTSSVSRGPSARAAAIKRRARLPTPAFCERVVGQFGSRRPAISWRLQRWRSAMLLFEQHKRLAVQPGQLDHRPEKAARREVEGHDVVLTHAVQVVIIRSEPQSPRPSEPKCRVRREDAH